MGSGLDKILQNVVEPNELRSKLETSETELQAVWQKLDKSNAQVATFQEDRRAEQAQMQQTLEQLRSQLSAKTAECQAAQDLLETQKRESQEATEQFHRDRDDLTRRLEQQSEELAKAKETIEQQKEQHEQLESQHTTKTPERQAAPDLSETQNQEPEEVDVSEQPQTKRDHSTGSFEPQSEELAEARETLERQEEQCELLESQLSAKPSEGQAEPDHSETQQQASEEGSAEISSMNRYISFSRSRYSAEK